MGKSVTLSVTLTACLLDRRFGNAVAAGESVSVRGVGLFSCAIVSSVVWERGILVGKGNGYNCVCNDKQKSI